MSDSNQQNRMLLQDIRLIVFDWDGTLMDSEGQIVTCLRAAMLDALHRYLGLEPMTLSDPTDRNVASYEPIPPEIEARLRRWFAPHEAALDAFLATHPARISAS